MLRESSGNGDRRIRRLLPSTEARRAYKLMGRCMRLCIARCGSGQAFLLHDPRWTAKAAERLRRPLTAAAAGELLHSGLVSELTERRHNERIGWREAGLPGEDFHVYALEDQAWLELARASNETSGVSIDEYRRRRGL